MKRQCVASLRRDDHSTLNANGRPVSIGVMVTVKEAT